MTWNVRVSMVALGLGAFAATAAPPSAALAQGASGTIEGRVIDAATTRPIEGVQVYVGGRSIGTVTNAQGMYRLPPVPMVNNARMTIELKVRMLGYNQASKSVEILVGQTSRADFGLTTSAVQLNQVVVTGTGQQVEIRKLGNTVAVVQKPEFAPIKNPSELLQGREPGVTGLPSGGLTGEGTRIRIRGNASLSQSNEPIVFLDGIRIDNGGGQSFGGVSTSRLDDIDPNSIERLEILKGAAAATLYGTEASNGVIQIFTKRGTSGAPKWDFEFDQAAIRFPAARIDPNTGFVGCRAYTYTGPAASPTGATCNNAAAVSAQLDTVNKLYGTTYQPYDLISRTSWADMMGTGKASTFNGSVMGGTTSVTYFVSGRLYREDGPLDGQGVFAPTEPIPFGRDFERKVQGTANVNIVPNSKLRMGFRSSYTDASFQSPSINNNIYAPGTLAMFAKPELANCNNSSMVAGQGRCVGSGNQLGNAAFGTVRETMLTDITSKTKRFIGSVDGAYTPVTSVNLTSTVGVDVTTQRGRLFRPFGWNVDNFTGNNVTGAASVTDRLNRVITVDSKGAWNKAISSKLTSDFVAGVQGFVTNVTYTGGSSAQFPGPGIEVASAGAPATTTVEESYVSIVNGGLFAQDQLGWNNFAFLTFGGRYDYASAFGKNTPGVFYPKVSLSVVPSDFPGWSSSVLSTFRVRSALGRSGKQPGAFDKFTTYGALAGEFGAGLAPSNLGNQDLKPEVSTEFEFGTELGLLNNKYGVDITLWNRLVSDALVNKQFAPSGGFRSAQLANIGSLKAQGAEISVKSLVINRPNLSLDLFANGAYIFQKIVSMGGAAPIKVGGSYVRYRNYLREGYAPGALFGVETPTACGSTPRPTTNAINNISCLNPGEVPFTTQGLGISGANRPVTMAELEAWLAVPRNVLTALNPFIIRRPGLCPLPDVACTVGDPLLNYQGKPTPNWNGGFGGTFTWRRNWRLGTLFEYKAGDFTVTNLTDAFRNAHGLIGNNSPEAARITSTLANPASTPQQRAAAALEWADKMAALTPYDGLNQNEKGDFMRWRELSLTYSASPDLASRVGARSMSLSLTGRNLVLWTKYAGMDPETNAIGRPNPDGGGVDNTYLDAVDAFGYPIPRRVSVSVRLGY